MFQFKLRLCLNKKNPPVNIRKNGLSGCVKFHLIILKNLLHSLKSLFKLKQYFEKVKLDL